MGTSLDKCLIRISSGLFSLLFFSSAVCAPSTATNLPEAAPLPSPQNTFGQPITRIQPRLSGIELPAQTAIVGQVLMDIVLDPGRKYDLPVTMLTALPIYDTQGVPVIPQGSLITSIIQKKDGGDYILIDRIVYRGLNIPIPSEGRLIPAQVKPENYGNFIIPPRTKASTVVSAIDQSSFTATLLAIALTQSFKNRDDGTQSQSITPLLLLVLGVDVGVKLIAALLDAPPQRLPPLVEIPRDSLIVFTLQVPIRLPDSSAPNTVILKGT